MKLSTKPEIELPEDIDGGCVCLCNMLNRIPGLLTTESCCGHGREQCRIWFRCIDIEVIARLARCVDRNYSSGLWRVVAENSDMNPVGLFCLETRRALSEQELSDESIQFVHAIEYWFSDRFDRYFSICKNVET